VTVGGICKRRKDMAFFGGSRRERLIAVFRGS
jgi:hypothetical protein